ncbi:MAG: argininosuccinate lyase [Egibacteraceae bacterium]
MTSGRLWGGRFSETPDAAAWALGRSVEFDARLWPHDLAGSRAHARELSRIGVLSPEEYDEIANALEQIAAEFSKGDFAFFPGDEDLHGAIERRLVELCGETGGRLRAGRSRNDQIVSDLRLYLRAATARLIGEVRTVQQALAEQAERALDWLVSGYTHLQRAQPVTLAHHLLAHAWALDRDAGRLADAARRLDVSTLGAGALAGTTLPLDPQGYAVALGLSHTCENSIDAVADRDFAVEFLAAAAMLGVHLSRFCEEVVLWTTAEFGWARVGEAFSTGSSIMPQKRNPDVAELVRGKTGRLVGDLVALLVTLKGLPLAYNRDLQEDKEPVFDAVDTLSLVLPAVAGMVASLRFDRERLAATAADPFALATDLAEALVAVGVPFPQAHQRVGQLVAEAERRGCALDLLVQKEGERVLPELQSPAALLDPALAVMRRTAAFGPAREQVQAQLADLRKRIDQDQVG